MFTSAFFAYGTGLTEAEEVDSVVGVVFNVELFAAVVILAVAVAVELDVI